MVEVVVALLDLQEQGGMVLHLLQVPAVLTAVVVVVEPQAAVDQLVV
jgi:hypothetical protein